MTIEETEALIAKTKDTDPELSEAYARDVSRRKKSSRAGTVVSAMESMSERKRCLCRGYLFQRLTGVRTAGGWLWVRRGISGKTDMQRKQ